MRSHDILFISMVHPGSAPFSVAIKTDRVYSVENVEILDEGLPSVKTVSSVDVVVYNEKVGDFLNVCSVGFNFLFSLSNEVVYLF